MSDVGAHHAWRLLLQALFMISKVLAVPSTIIVSAANNARRVFIATSLLQTPNRPRTVSNFRGQNVAKDRAIFRLAKTFSSKSTRSTSSY
jgi:hypothetical protein